MPGDPVPEPQLRSHRTVIATPTTIEWRRVVGKVQGFFKLLTSEQVAQFAWSARRVPSQSQRMSGVYATRRRCDSGGTYVGQSANIWSRREFHRDLNGGVKPAVVLLMTDSEAETTIDGVDPNLIGDIINEGPWAFLAPYAPEVQRRIVARTVAEAVFVATHCTTTPLTLEMYAPVDESVVRLLSPKLFNNPLMSAVSTGNWPDATLARPAFGDDGSDRWLELSWITGICSVKRMANEAGLEDEWENQERTGFCKYGAYDLTAGGAPFADFVDAVPESAEQPTLLEAIKCAQAGDFETASKLGQSITSLYSPPPRSAVQAGALADMTTNVGLQSSDFVIMETAQASGLDLQVLAVEHGLKLCRFREYPTLIIVTPCVWPAVPPRSDFSVAQILFHVRALVALGSLLRGPDAPSTARLSLSMMQAYREYGAVASIVDLNTDGLPDMIDVDRFSGAQDEIEDDPADADDEDAETLTTATLTPTAPTISTTAHPSTSSRAWTKRRVLSKGKSPSSEPSYRGSSGGSATNLLRPS